MASALLVAGCGLVGLEYSTRERTSPPSAPPSPTTGPLADYYNQQVTWKNCGGADCATIVVPLDYDDPNGPTVELAITRVSATGDKIGSLFVNPGGPGGSAVDYAKAAEYIVTDEVRERYDIVGLDPRGVGTSEPVNCYTDALVDQLIATDVTPDSLAEEEVIVDESTQLGKECEANADALYAHMGTVDAARDHDIARAAVGDTSFNMLGKSYGTMLGATYAELFPERVGRMVLDGALPPSLDLAEVSRDQAISFEDVLRDFVRHCQEYSDCSLTGGVDSGMEQLRAFLTGLDADPIPAGDRVLNEPVATSAVLSNVYFGQYDYDRLRPALAAAMNDRVPDPLLALLDDRMSRGPDGQYLDNSTDAFYSITCIDRPFTGTVEDVKGFAEEWSRQAPTLGASLAWGLLACKDWPATGDVILEADAAGSDPILVVSTTHDPATPYQWGVRLADELENAALLSWDGYGHTAYFNGSSCIDEAVDAYLLDGTLPEDGLVCQ